MESNKNYHMKDILFITGVTKRTLHYYHEIGLLIPSKILENGRRTYTQDDLVKLQKILFLKASGLKIKEISSIIDKSDEIIRGRLTNQIAYIENKIHDLHVVKEELNQFIKGTPLIELEIISTSLATQYNREAEILYGHTPAFHSFLNRMDKLSDNEMQIHNLVIEQKFNDTYSRLALEALKGEQSDYVEELVMEWQCIMMRIADFDVDTLLKIATLYESDPRFYAYFEKYGPKFASFLCTVITRYLSK